MKTDRLDDEWVFGCLGLSFVGWTKSEDSLIGSGKKEVCRDGMEKTGLSSSTNGVDTYTSEKH